MTWYSVRRPDRDHVSLLRTPFTVPIFLSPWSLSLPGNFFDRLKRFGGRFGGNASLRRQKFDPSAFSTPDTVQSRRYFLSQARAGRVANDAFGRLACALLCVNNIRRASVPVILVGGCLLQPASCSRWSDDSRCRGPGFGSNGGKRAYPSAQWVLVASKLANGGVGDGGDAHFD